MRNNILDCYAKTAGIYAKKFFGELDHKHFDRMLLKHFAAERSALGTVIDLGCGPGQTTAYLNKLGVSDILGTDLSEEMVAEARRLSPHIAFETADLLDLNYPQNRFASAIAFYAVVHFDYRLLAEAFRSVRSVLKPDGHFLLSFHLGKGSLHLDSFLDTAVNIDFRFFQMQRVKKIAVENGFEIVDALQRDPYPETEYASKRGYLWLKRAAR